MNKYMPIVISTRELNCKICSCNTNFLLTESAVITGKYQTGVLTVRTEPLVYKEDLGLIFSSDD